MSENNFVPMLKAVHELMVGDSSLDEHWEQLVNVLAEYGFTADKQECEIKHSLLNDPQYLFTIVAEFSEDFPQLLLQRYGRMGWIVTVGDNSHWSFVQKKDGLYGIDVSDQLMKI